jgi:threonine synthase
MWRYGSLLPVQNPARGVSLGEGATPLIRSRLPWPGSVFWKDESRNPTGSQKDRALSLAITAMAERGESRPILASTGSAGISAAAYASLASMVCTVLLPQGTSRTRAILMAMYGARVIEVASGYEEIMELIATATREYGYTHVSTFRAANVFQMEGPKTIAYEIFEALGDLPDLILVPVGGGGTLAGIARGLAELRELGWTRKQPRLVGIQNARLNALERALAGGLSHRAELESLGLDPLAPVETINLRHAVPPDWEDALAALRLFDGQVVSVTDEEALAAQAELARGDGILAEPSSAVVIPALRILQARGVVKGSDVICGLITGSGYRDLPQLERTQRPEVAQASRREALHILKHLHQT